MLKNTGGNSQSRTKKKVAAISKLGKSSGSSSKVKSQRAQTIKTKPAKPSARRPYGG